MKKLTAIYFFVSRETCWQIWVRTGVIVGSQKCRSILDSMVWWCWSYLGTSMAWVWISIIWRQWFRRIGDPLEFGCLKILRSVVKVYRIAILNTVLAVVAPVSIHQIVWSRRWYDLRVSCAWEVWRREVWVASSLAMYSAIQGTSRVHWKWLWLGFGEESGRDRIGGLAQEAIGWGGWEQCGAWSNV